MKKASFDCFVDVDDEIKCLIDYTCLKWQGIPKHNIELLVKNTFMAGLDAGKYFFNRYSDNIYDLLKKLQVVRNNKESWQHLKKVRQIE